MCQACSQGFRFDLTDLATGRVKAVAHPISAEWEDALCQPSTATLMVATREPAQADVWATETGLYISRVNQDGSREPYWGGYIVDFDGSGGGATKLACVSMDEYLNHRLVADDDGGLNFYAIGLQPFGDVVYVTKPVDTNPSNDIELFQQLGAATQSFVARTLVGLTMNRGIPLTAQIVAPDVVPWKESEYRWWEFKNIGSAIRAMVEAEDGLKYWLEHSYANGFWSTVIQFSDAIGTLRDYTLRSDYEGWQYGLQVDGKDKASRVYGVGSGTEENTLFSVAYDAAERLPEFQATVAWKDQTIPATIDKLTFGYVNDHRDPTTVPSMTLVGLPTSEDPGKGFPPPELLKPGDQIKVDIGYGVITVQDILVKCLGVTWKLAEGSPIQRVIAMLPVVRPADSIRTQTPARVPAAAQPIAAVPTPAKTTPDPWPTPGLVMRIHPNHLHEISGTQLSYANPNHIWVHNDNEVGGDLGVIYLIALSGPEQGNDVGRFRLNPATFEAASDFEAIRRRPSDGMLHIGDLGDNGGVRNHGQLYRLVEPVGGGNKGVLNAEVITLQYPFGGGWVNTESLMIHPNGNVFTITKENGKARVVNFGANPTGTVMGTLVWTLPDADFVVDATFTHDGLHFLVRTNHNDPTFVYSATTGKREGKIATPAMPKSEGITLDYGNCSFMVTTEAKPHAPISQTETPVYRVLIPPQFGATCGTPAGSSGTPSTGPSGPAVPGNILNLSEWKLTLPRN